MEDLTAFQNEKHYCIVCAHWNKCQQNKKKDYGNQIECLCDVSGKFKKAMDTCGNWKSNEPMLPGVV